MIRSNCDSSRGLWLQNVLCCGQLDSFQASSMKHEACGRASVFSSMPSIVEQRLRLLEMEMEMEIQMEIRASSLRSSTSPPKFWNAPVYHESMIHVCRTGCSRLLKQHSAPSLSRSRNFHHALTVDYAAHHGGIWHNATRPTIREELGYGWTSIISTRPYTKSKKAVRQSKKDAAVSLHRYDLIAFTDRHTTASCVYRRQPCPL